MDSGKLCTPMFPDSGIAITFQFIQYENQIQLCGNLWTLSLFLKSITVNLIYSPFYKGGGGEFSKLPQKDIQP